MTTQDLEGFTAIAQHAAVPMRMVGVVRHGDLEVSQMSRGTGGTAVPLADLRRSSEGFFPDLMGADAAFA